MASDTEAADEEDARRPSGRFVVRIEPALHEALRWSARGQGLSLNAYCVRKLSAASPDAEQEDAARAIRRAEQVCGEHLVGVVVFGSWARGEAAADSDVDVLVVVEPIVPLTRGLYRRWDEDPVTWAGRAVEPHFVHLPAGEAPRGGVWAEVAVDGIVVHERDYLVSRWLGRVRASILSGRMARRSVHGQPFWVEATADAES